jgi:DNA polymerase III delta prime subunit
MYASYHVEEAADELIGRHLTQTSTILAAARSMYGSKMGSMTLELNASDDRGIGVVRDQIKSFASTKQLFSRYC